MGVDVQAVTVLVVVVGVLLLLAFTRIAADVVLAAAVTLLVTFGIVPLRDALAGMANEGMITVGVLFIIAAAIRETGALTLLLEPILGSPRSVTQAQARLVFPVAFMSAFLNNTPIVAMLIPVVSDWTKRHGISVSKLLLPLSYATILGGTCTLIGTSTNLVVFGLMRERDPAARFGFFDLGWIGVPCALVGLAWILLASRRLLPERRPATALFADPREYTVEMFVEPTSPLVGRTIEEAGLRRLPGLYLMEIARDGDVLPAVSSGERLHAGDRLVFAGVVDSVVELQRIRGLVPARDQIFKIEGERSQRRLVEVVVSDACPLVGRSIREGRFRSRYDAAVIAVARNGARLAGRIGDIVLRVGDTLLLETHPWFAEQHRNSRDFCLVSMVAGSATPRHDRAWIALGILALLVVVAGTGTLGMLNAAAIAAGLMIATRCIGTAQARDSVDWSVLVVIASSFALGRALETTGLAAWLVDGLVRSLGASPWTALAAVYAAGMVCNAVITNNAAAVLMFPVAMATADRLGVSPMPFVVATMMAGSNDFATPIGYQTNLLVYGPGGYRFGDYLRFGGPLNILVWVTAVALIPYIWPF